MTDSDAALSGLTVLDFTAGVAGPHATQIMAQNGAEVIKVEPVGGEWGRTLGKAYGEFTAHSIAFNRGKKSLAVDLKDARVREILLSLARHADVVAESFRPGVMARLGFSYEALSADNPALVYLSVSGFGQEGPYRDRPVTDAVIQAFSGWMTMNRDRAGVPQRSGMVAMDVLTGLYGYNAVTTALLARARSGRGRWIDCNLMQAAAAFQTPKIIEYHLQAGEVGNLYAPVGAFSTADGQINITTMRDDHFAALCRVLGRPDLPQDPRFDGGAARLANETALTEILSAEFRKRPSAEWAAELTGAGVMNAVVQSYADYLADAHVAAVGSYEWREQSVVGAVPIPAIPGTPPAAGSSPHIGQDSRQVLRAAGLADREIADLIEAGRVRCGEAPGAG